MHNEGLPFALGTHQSSATEFVLCINDSAFFQKRSRHFNAPVDCSLDQRGITFFIACVHVWSLCKQQPYGICPASHQRGLTHQRFRVHVGSTVEKQLGDRGVVVHHSTHQRRYPKHH